MRSLNEDAAMGPTLSPAQDKAITLLPVAPSILSIMGSFMIVYSILTTSRKSTTTFKRLLLGLSICDMICTILLPFSVFMLPADTSLRVWASGNEKTTAMLGFFTQFFFSVIIYNGMISFYFILSIRYGYKEDAFVKRIEPMMHFFALGYPLITAVIGAAKGFYHEVEIGPGSWISVNVEECDDNTITFGRVCTGDLVSWLFGGVAIDFILVSLIVNNFLIYFYIRSTVNGNALRRSTSLSASMQDERNPSLCSMALCSNRRRSRTIAKVDPEERRIRSLSTQSYRFALAFFTCYTWTILIRSLESAGYDRRDEHRMYGLLLLQSILLPLQGFFNLVIYVKPSYERSLKSFPQETRLWAFRRAILGAERVPPSYLAGSVQSRRSLSLRPATTQRPSTISSEKSQKSENSTIHSGQDESQKQTNLKSLLDNDSETSLSDLAYEDDDTILTAAELHAITGITGLAEDPDDFTDVDHHSEDEPPQLDGVIV